MKIVLLGGGHSHAIVLKKFGMNSLKNCKITLVSPLSMTPYSGMVPGLVSGHYSFADCHIDLRHLCQFAGARFIQDSAIGIDPLAQTVNLQASPPLPYDLLSIDIGITPSLSVLGDRDAISPVKPIHLFLQRLDAFSEYLKKTKAPSKICITGGGAGGLEIAFSLKERFRSMDFPPEVHIYHSGADILESSSPKIRSILRKTISEKSIQLHCGEKVNRVVRLRDSQHKISVNCESGLSAEFNFLVFTTSAAPAEWIVNSNLPKDSKGFLSVNSYLQCTSHPDIFAAGDIASMEGEALEKSGVYAVRQGLILYENLIRKSQNKKLLQYKPQKYFLSLLSTGDGKAIAKRKVLALSPASWIWYWKDRIDRQFMDSFKNLPPKLMMDGMTEKKDSELKCMGCGSKIGSDVLQRALDRVKHSPFLDSEAQEPLLDRISKIVKTQMKIHSSSRMIIGNDKRDDSAVISIPAGKYAVQSIDFFKPIISDSFVAAKITANHCLNDLYAMGASPDTAMALVTLPEMEEGETEEELVRVLTGISSVLLKEDCKLIGGHTNEGKEFTIGLSCMGLVDAGSELHKEYCREGDKLILTKPIGTGLIFALEMRNLSKAQWIESAIESMILSNGSALDSFKEYRVRAITDISGFGLVGHLLTLLKASGKSAQIDWESLPFLEGIPEILKTYPTIKSSLYPSNRKTYESFVKMDAGIEESLLPMLYDPQTSGGLLGVVPEDTAERCVDALLKKGYKASIIGEISYPSIEVRIRKQNR